MTIHIAEWQTEKTVEKSAKDFNRDKNERGLIKQITRKKKIYFSKLNFYNASFLSNKKLKQIQYLSMYNPVFYKF